MVTPSPKKVTTALKKAWKSKTIQFNALMAFLLSVPPEVWLQILPQLQGILPTNLYEPLSAILVAGNVLLRFKTSQALADK